MTHGRALVAAGTAAAWVSYWIGARAGYYSVYPRFVLVLAAALVCGMLIGRWWAIALSVVPAAIVVGVESDDAPAFLVVLLLITPLVGVALAAGVGIVKGIGLLGRRQHADAP